jgi:excisionase family DNA binding protein
MSHGNTTQLWPAKDEEMYSVRPAAQKIGIQEKTLRTWIAAGRIGYVRLGTRTIRVPLSEVNRILSEGYQPAKN